MERASHKNGEGSMKVDGHRLTLVVEGPERLRALLDLIEGARYSLRLYYYIFEADASGVMVRDALLDALNRGVTVSCIVDGFGSNRTPDMFFAILKAAGCRFFRFAPRFGRRYLLRNHQKIAIADHGRALIGGFNIGNDYFAPPEAERWHDLGLVVQGPAVSWLVTYYDGLSRWVQLDKPGWRALRRILEESLPPQRGPLRWLLGGPSPRLNPWARTVKHDLERARRADMVEAYFSPGRSMLKRIGRVAQREGGAARLVTASQSDNAATVGAARLLYGLLLRRDVEVYEYLPGLLHMKLIVVDDVVYIGSANFDMRSLYLNMELMLRIDDAGFADAMRRFFEQQLASCERITPELHRARANVITRGRWMLAYLIVGVMDYTITRRLNFGLD